MLSFLHNIDWVLSIRVEWLTPVFKAVTVLGYGSFLLLFIPFGVWIIDKNIFGRAGLLLFLSALLNLYLKDYFNDPRPSLIYQLDRGVGVSHGFPSGHAQMAVVLWFWIAYEARKRWVWIVCSILVVAICFSRLYLGVHDVEDILGGLFIGGLTLAVSIWFYRSRMYERLLPSVQIAILMVAVAMLIAVWAGPAPKKAFIYGGIIIGFWSGVLIERRMIHYRCHEKKWVRVPAVLSGLLVIIGLRMGVEKIVVLAPSVKFLPSMGAAIIGFCITAGIPWLMIRIKLAREEKL